MTNTPPVSILMPTNTTSFLDEAIDSVMKQTYKKWKLLIGVNNYKADPTLPQKIKETLPSDDRIQLYLLDECYSKSDALNELINHCSSEIVCLLDSDDMWSPSKLEKQIPLIQKYDIIGTNCSYFGPQAASFAGGPYLPLGEIPPQLILANNPIINSSAMFSKKDAKWDPEYEGIEDYDMWLRLNREGLTFYNIPEIHCLHRIHFSSSFNHSNTDHLVESSRNKWKF